MHRRYIHTLIPILAIFVGVVVAIIAPTGPTHAQPAKENARTILPGEGVKGCRVGGPIQAARDLFGKPSSEPEGYIRFADHGIDMAVEEGKIRAIFFYYRSHTHRQYAGKTDKGIGKESSIEDVIKQYGKPDRIDESVVSEFGPEPGAKEQYLSYVKLGIAFTFYDKQLADVRVFRKKE